MSTDCPDCLELKETNPIAICQRCSDAKDNYDEDAEEYWEMNEGI